MNKLLFMMLIAFTTINTINAQTATKQIKPISTTQSVVKWKGSMLFNFGQHYGTVKFEEGQLEFRGNELSGGNFIVNMSTMANTDGGYNEGLMDHLKNEDFFDVQKHPKAKFVLTKIEPVKNGDMRITGNLTIKGITKPVIANAHLDRSNRSFGTRLKIDRTEWNIVYSTKGNVEVKDYAISDAIELDVLIQY